MSLDLNYTLTIFKDTVTNHYVDFEKRVSRTDFWHYVVFWIAVYIVLIIIASILGGVGRLIYTLVLLGLILPNLGIAVRRLHDIGKTGWWVLLGLIPILGAIVLIYFYAQPGDAGDNEYGPVPPLRSA